MQALQQLVQQISNGLVIGLGIKSVDYGFWGINISTIQILILVIGVVLMVVLHLFVTRTVTGAAMRAAAQNMTTAMLMGIGVNRIIPTTFLAGSVNRYPSST
jgi:branched-subunit amino acid ABC-type transport system permease component